MNDDIQTAVLFTAGLIKNKNIIFLTPQKIIIGEANEDATYFESYLDDREYQNADDAVREENYECFYNVVKISELKDKYGVEDLNELFSAYFEDLYTKVYYYEMNDDSFESYFMKKCSIEEFNNKFGLNFTYDFGEEVVEEVKVLDPVTKNFKSIKETLDKNILFQNEAKDKLINTLYNNYTLRDSKSNIIISGPNGVGKSEMLKLMANSSTQPVIYTKFTPNLIDDPKEYLDSLLLNVYYVSLSKEDPTISNVIIIDEFDKEFSYTTALEVTDEISKFIKNGKRFIRYPGESRNGIIMDSKNVTFIICGNFTNVKREKVVPFSFFNDDSFSYDNIPLSLNESDLEISYGFSKEALESFNTHIDFKPLTLSKTKKIMVTSNNSLFINYCKKLKAQGITIDISDETIDLICKKVYSKTNNIKNINNVISDIFKDIITESFTLDEGTNIVVREDIVKDSKKFSLKKM